MKNENGFPPRTLATLATLATQTLKAANLLGDPRPAPPEIPAAPAADPQEEPEGATLADDGETWHDFTRRELLALADPTERADLEADPDALEAFAFALRLAEIRARGERPDHYTRAAYCETCGPVWLFPGAAARVLGCPWCENTTSGRPVSLPLVRCSGCQHWRPDAINPPGGLGSCATEAPASMRPGTLWPRGEITCGNWQPKHDAP